MKNNADWSLDFHSEACFFFFCKSHNEDLCKLAYLQTLEGNL